MFGYQVDFHVVTLPQFLSQFYLWGNMRINWSGLSVGTQYTSHIIGKCVRHGYGKTKPSRAPRGTLHLSETKLCGKVKN